MRSLLNTLATLLSLQCGLFYSAYAQQAVVSSDTLGWATYHQGVETEYFAPNGGYVFGNNGYGDQVKARVFASPDGQFGRATKVIFKFASKTFNSADPESRLIVRYYGLRGLGQMSTGTTIDLAPGNELIDTITSGGSDIVYFTQFLYMDDVDTSGYTSLEAPVPAAAPVYYNHFAVGLDFTSLASGDSVGLYSNTDGDGESEEMVWDLTADGQWVTVQHPILGWDLAADPAIFVEFEYEENQPTGIQNENLLSFSLSPNPSTDRLWISQPLEQTELELLNIWNLEGQMIKEIDGSQISGNRFSVDVTDLPTGMYVLRMVNHEQAASRLFQVIH